MEMASPTAPEVKDKILDGFKLYPLDANIIIILFLLLLLLLATASMLTGAGICPLACVACTLTDLEVTLIRALAW